MSTTLALRHGLPILCALGLAACAGGGESGTGATSKTSVGTITRFGSVFVNGVEYDTNGSAITLDGLVQNEDKLAIGMVVKLKGSVNADGKTGKAMTIEYADDLEGVVFSVDAATNVLNVMGQTVHVGTDTLFTGVLNLAAINLGNIVEVSGYSSGRGDIHATRIELKKVSYTGGEIELKGIVSNLTPTTFAIGTLTIDYSTALLEVGNGLSDGVYVEVKSIQVPVNNRLVASSIEIENGGKKAVVASAGENLTLEGTVAAVNSPSAFELNGQSVISNAQTRYENGIAAGVVVDAKLEVEGSADAAGNLVAETISFREAGDIRIKAAVSATDPTLNTVTVLGLTLQTNNLTVMNDERDSSGQIPLHYFGVKDLHFGDFVEARIYRIGGNSFIATQLIRDDNPGVVTLTGAVEDVSTSGRLTVAGIIVMIPSGNTLLFTNGMQVKIVGGSGSYSGGVLWADSISLDD